MTTFIPGLDLCERFFHEAVKPILDSDFPALIYSAALIGAGSDVLGYDTVRSTDHDWGPRLHLFLSDDDYAEAMPRIDAALRQRLPPTFRGYPTSYEPPEDLKARRQQTEGATGPNHMVGFLTPNSFFTSWIGLDPLQDLTPVDWLYLPQQKLLEVTAGRIYHDGLGTLAEARAKLAYYPHDVWLYLMACQWSRISEQEHFVGRAGEVGDELGSGIIAAILVRDLMQLRFLMERRYFPYTKWFGTAFSRLACAPTLVPLFRKVLNAPSWQEREEHLSAAYEIIAGLHNALAITPPVDPTVRFFFDRPFRVLFAGRFLDAIAETITDPAVRAVVDLAGWVGSVDQISDNVPLLGYAAKFKKLAALYGRSVLP